MTSFIRVLDSAPDAKAGDLFDCIATIRTGKESSARVFERSSSSFSAVPGSPFAYWVSNGLLRIFRDVPRFEAPDGRARSARGGAMTLDDNRFMRATWEHGGSQHWVPLAKGGPVSSFYSDVHLALGWGETGRQLRAFYELRAASAEWGGFARNEECYFRPGLTWSLRASGLAFRVLPRACIFGRKGPGVFVQGDDAHALLSLVALLNSSAFRYLVSAQLARTELAQSYEVGIIQQTPVPFVSGDSESTLALLGRRAWSLMRMLDSSNETSHAFLLPRVLTERLAHFDCVEVQGELETIRQKIDDLSLALYGIGEHDRTEIVGGTWLDQASFQTDDTDARDDGSACHLASPGVVSDGPLTSWLVGVAFGRFDPRLATGERTIPSEPDPFDPLPSRSPGMFPVGEEPKGCPDILVDDQGNSDDLAARSLAVAERVKATVSEGLRDWLAKEFFPLHIKMYSKSRRKAPIYWQLATPSASYSVWLYIHAFTKDTLFRAQNDYVAPKLAHEERRLESLESELRDGATAAQRKQLAAQELLVDELRAFLDEVKRVAPLWNPNLDDGVMINFAPLWRLVPQNKFWQKELKSTWDQLCAGDYDWAHLAMHLWPERVVPKCAKDRSLAIAHGLEDVFWVEGNDGKWTARKAPTRKVDELVRERTSSAVKAALRSLLDAPAPPGGSGRGRGGRKRGGSLAEEEGR